jgi:proteasome accessory factor B
MEAYVQEALVIMRGRRIDVELLFSKTVAAWVKDKLWHSSQETVPMKDGRLRMTLRVADTDELTGWILSFGSQVRVLSPKSLGDKISEEAKKVFGAYR